MYAGKSASCSTAVAKVNRFPSLAIIHVGEVNCGLVLLAPGAKHPLAPSPFRGCCQTDGGTPGQVAEEPRRPFMSNEVS